MKFCFLVDVSGKLLLRLLMLINLLDLSIGALLKHSHCLISSSLLIFQGRD